MVIWAIHEDMMETGKIHRDGTVYFTVSLSAKKFPIPPLVNKMIKS